MFGAAASCCRLFFTTEELEARKSTCAFTRILGTRKRSPEPTTGGHHAFFLSYKISNLKSRAVCTLHCSGSTFGRIENTRLHRLKSHFASQHSSRIKSHFWHAFCYGTIFCSPRLYDRFLATNQIMGPLPITAFSSPSPLQMQAALSRAAPLPWSRKLKFCAAAALLAAAPRSGTSLQPQRNTAASCPRLRPHTTLVLFRRRPASSTPRGTSSLNGSGASRDTVALVRPAPPRYTDPATPPRRGSFRTLARSCRKTAAPPLRSRREGIKRARGSACRCSLCGDHQKKRTSA
mmetsp:Transcript_18926/g.47265  ORF Transcript_18926/g.47265 Transcript_18926/m.47265 type:complete len:291 (-) Transcript_18926:3220-4092(-)